MTEPPPLTGIYETVLYGPDVPALARFYAEILGLRLIDVAADGLFAACRIPDAGVLLLFYPALSSEPGHSVPSHGTSGPGHVAFRVGDGGLPSWMEHLAERELEIERIVEWGGGLASVYVRDPAGN